MLVVTVSGRATADTRAARVNGARNDALPRHNATCGNQPPKRRPAQSDSDAHGNPAPNARNNANKRRATAG
eukprot:5319383-Lingulodinium_polyedra.AAC.1